MREGACSMTTRQGLTSTHNQHGSALEHRLSPARLSWHTTMQTSCASGLQSPSSFFSGLPLTQMSYVACAMAVNWFRLYARLVTGLRLSCCAPIPVQKGVVSDVKRIMLPYIMLALVPLVKRSCRTSSQCKRWKVLMLKVPLRQTIVNGC